MFRFEKLTIWQEANRYADEVYKISKNFPKEEVFGLTSQLRRSVNSISANIAEGSAARSIKDFNNYLEIAIKSTYETVSWIYRAESLGYVDKNQRSKLYQNGEILVKQMRSFQKSLRSKT